MERPGRTVIVGGGILGLGVAAALENHGRQVVVLDRGPLGAGSTALAAGLLSLQTWNDADAQLIAETRSEVEALVAWGRGESLAAANTAWRRTGAVTVADKRHRNHLVAIHARLRRMGESAELLDAAEAARRWPILAFGDDETVLWSAGEGYLESTDLVQLVRARLRDRGVSIREGVAASSLHLAQGRVRGVQTADGEVLEADQVVVAAGARTPALLRSAGIAVAAIPYRTQLAALDLPGLGAFPILHDAIHGFYARPESDGRFLAGDGTQLRPFDPEAFDAAADQPFIESIARGVVSRFRDGAAARYRTGWAGLVVGTPDRRPLAGPVAGVDGLFVATGDNGFGLMRGLALGRLVARALERVGDPRLAALDPSRFGDPPPAHFPLSEGFSFPPTEEAPAKPARSAGRHHSQRAQKP